MIGGRSKPTEEIRMSRRLAVRLAVPLAAAGATAAILAAGSGAQPPTGRTITLVTKERDSRGAFVDAAPRVRNPRRPAASIGDAYVFTQTVYDAAGTARVGTLSATCTFPRRARNPEGAPMLCHGVYHLQDGDVVGAGLLSGNPGRIAITGGTGAYAGARGTLTTTESRTGSTDVIELLP
jgi:hypothetical protein